MDSPISCASECRVASPYHLRLLRPEPILPDACLIGLPVKGDQTGQRQSRHKQNMYSRKSSDSLRRFLPLIETLEQILHTQVCGVNYGLEMDVRKKYYWLITSELLFWTNDI